MMMLARSNDPLHHSIPVIQKTVNTTDPNFNRVEGFMAVLQRLKALQAIMAATLLTTL
jgi:hypothetical protein